MSQFDTVAPLEEAKPKTLADFTDRELAEAIYLSQLRVEAQVKETLASIGPTMDALSRSPMLKMLGIKF